MGSKSKKCCCCGCLRGRTTCCACTCRRLCVTFTPTPGSVDDDYNECPVDSKELHWDEEELAFIGEVAGIDVRYYFEQEYGAESCLFKLRSSSLGHPEGYELAWIVGPLSFGGEIECRTLGTSVSVPEDPQLECSEGTLTTSCATKIVPRTCSGCSCACECLCVTYSKNNTLVGGKICWDGLGQWQGTLQISDDETKDVTIAMFPRGLLCDPYDPYCDPEDTTCAMVLSLGNDAAVESIEPNCPDILAQWVIPNDYDGDEIVTIRCAECEEGCEVEPKGCCPNTQLPDTLFVTLEATIQIWARDARNEPEGTGYWEIQDEYECMSCVLEFRRTPPDTTWILVAPTYIPNTYGWATQDLDELTGPLTATDGYIGCTSDPDHPDIGRFFMEINIGNPDDPGGFCCAYVLQRFLFISNCEPIFGEAVIDFDDNLHVWEARLSSSLTGAEGGGPPEPAVNGPTFIESCIQNFPSCVCGPPITFPAAPDITRLPGYRTRIKFTVTQ